jgi:hypothetical protein
MEVLRKTAWQRYFQFRLRSLLWFAVVCCLVVHFGSPAWQWAFPPAHQLPSPYTIDDVQYFAPGPEFKLSIEAATIKAAQNQSH